jgi:hypothetical protein
LRVKGAKAQRHKAIKGFKRAWVQEGMGSEGMGSEGQVEQEKIVVKNL